MFSIGSSGEICLTRGDTARIDVNINQGTSMNPVKYIIQPGDEIYFGLMEPNQPFEQAILKKKLTSKDLVDSTLFIILNPKDTMCLLPGLYYYQIKAKIFNPAINDFMVNTIINKKRFYIEE